MSATIHRAICIFVIQKSSKAGCSLSYFLTPSSASSSSSSRMELGSSQMWMEKLYNSSCWVLSWHNPTKTYIGEFEFLEQETYLKPNIMLPKFIRTDSSAREGKRNAIGIFFNHQWNWLLIISLFITNKTGTSMF